MAVFLISNLNNPIQHLFFSQSSKIEILIQSHNCKSIRKKRINQLHFSIVLDSKLILHAIKFILHAEYES